MTLNLLRFPAAAALGAVLLTTSVLAQSRPAEPSSPYGGSVVEDIIARVNDQIITRSDFNRAQKELDDEARQHGATMQQISEGHKDLLRNLIDQQLWLSKGKELGITGETELVNRLNEIRKQYNLGTLEDLEKAAQEQGVSYEDFKANIRNQIVTQEVMRQEVGRHISVTPGEVQRYFEEHQKEYVQPESVRLSEILVSTPSDDPQKVEAAKAKADDIESKLKAGANFAELARTSSEGTTAAQGGDLGTYKRGELAKVFEDATFGLKPGEYTEPIRTRQGFVIFHVDQHNGGGVPSYKDVQNQVEENYYMAKMEPAIRQYLTKMRDDAAIFIANGYTDTGASPNKNVYPISFSTYTPPAPKKKKKVERTRFRETGHFRQKTAEGEQDRLAASSEKKADKPAKNSKAEVASEKPGKKEKIRFGKAPTKTLPSEPQGTTEDAGAGTQVAQSAEPENPLEAAPEQKKTRFSDRARTEKKNKHKAASGQKTDPLAPAPPDAAEVADRQTQSAALGLNGDANAKKKKKATTTGEKTRFSDKKKDESQDKNATPEPTPIPAVPGAPAPSAAPAQPAAPAQQ